MSAVSASSNGSLEEAAAELAAESNSSLLLGRALCHRSYCAEHNERLEFLGDAVLDLLITEELYRRYPTASEGQMSRLRAQMVCRPSLARLAVELKLEPLLKVGRELKGKPLSPGVLCAVVEAVVGALFLELGWQQCGSRVMQWFAPQFAALPETLPRNVAKDAKTTLKELLEARGLSLPQFRLDEGQPNCAVHCRLPSIDVTVVGNGRTKRMAEQDAAAQLLKILWERKWG